MSPRPAPPLLAIALAASALAGCLEAASPLEVASTAAFAAGGGAGDAVVVAVIDYVAVNPYHHDWRAASTPQHLDADAANDLPLHAPPHEWLPGFPDPAGFASYSALDLSLTDDPDALNVDLIAKDADAWADVRASGRDEVHYYHVPGTKVIGLVEFGGPGGPVGNSSAHGARASSVAAGNLFGACPECLLVFVHTDGTEAPIEWALSQPWIDVVSASFAYTDFGGVPGAARTFAYAGSDLDLSRAAAERGQTVFWTASNGIEGAGVVPTSTLLSSQFGPDWVVTVAAVAPSGGSWSGAGKPADVAGLGQGYPSQGEPTVTSAGTMGGTSVATPTVAGTYARALWAARAALDGASRAQEEGVVARGPPLACGVARAECELADGVLTAAELRTRLLHAAAHTAAGLKPGGGPVPPAPAFAEGEFMAEGHGTFWGRSQGDEAWLAEHERVLAPMLGTAPAPERPAGEREWMVVDSWCRQRVWGAWSGGYFVDAETPLPDADPAWPARTAYAAACPHLARPARA